MATYYIATTGNDSTGAGTSGNPWLTISKAHTSASSGDTIICANGTYTMVSQTFTKSLTIQATTNNSVTFNASSGNFSWTNATNNVTITITGINFTGNSSSATNILFVAWSTNGSTFTFTDCKFYDLYGPSDLDNGGIFSVTANSSPGTFNFTNCLFYNLYCVDNTAGGGHAAIISGRRYTATFTNCTAYFNQSGTACFKNVAKSQSGTGNIFTSKNCIWVANSGTMTILASVTSGSVTVTSTYTCQYGNWSTVTSGTGNTTSDPLFVDAANGNFNLRPNSPCLDTGTSL